MIMVIIITIIVLVSRPHKTLCVTQNTHHTWPHRTISENNRRNNGRSSHHGSIGGLVQRFLGEGDESAGGEGVGGEAQGAARDDGSKPPPVLSNVVPYGIGIIDRKDAFRRPSTSQTVDTIGPL